MRLNGVNNEPLGIVSLAEAFRLAEEANVDLVEIAPNATPPVCRLMDYGKFKYSEQKKAHEAKLKAAGLRVHADLRNEKITYKIREHSVQKLPYILVVGDKERDANTVAVRARGNIDLGVMSVDALLERLQGEVASKAK